MREAFAGIQADFARDVTARYGADFETEMQNPDFARLMGAGVPPKTAYEVIHQQEIAQAQAQLVANQARENVMRTIQNTLVTRGGGGHAPPRGKRGTSDPLRKEIRSYV